jgi:S1-C subfamily serine protease
MGDCRGKSVRACGTVTAGIVSACSRDITPGSYSEFIQIDAPVNQGNSGGPTFDVTGKVIGINSAIVSPTGGSVGIGFAIPAETVRTVVANLRDKGKVVRGWLGVSIQAISPETAEGARSQTDARRSRRRTPAERSRGEGHPAGRHHHFASGQTGQRRA